MKRLFSILSLAILLVFSGCTGDDGPQGPPGPESEVFELRNVNFTLNNNNEYTIFRQLNPQILDSDTILIYRLAGTTNPTTPVWQLIPRTLFLLQERELDYDFDFTRADFTIYLGSNYNLTTTPEYINNQTFRIVIIPGFFSRSSTALDMNDYNAVIKAYGINDKNVTVLK
jgi:hypothetical protein